MYEKRLPAQMPGRLTRRLTTRTRGRTGRRSPPPARGADRVPDDARGSSFVRGSEVDRCRGTGDATGGSGRKRAAFVPLLATLRALVAGLARVAEVCHRVGAAVLAGRPTHATPSRSSRPADSPGSSWCCRGCPYIVLSSPEPTPSEADWGIETYTGDRHSSIGCSGNWGHNGLLPAVSDGPTACGVGSRGAISRRAGRPAALRPAPRHRRKTRGCRVGRGWPPDGTAA